MVGFVVVRVRSFAWRIALLLLFGVAQATHAQSRRPSVLLLLPLPTAAPANSKLEEGFRRGLATRLGTAVDFRVEYLDLADGQNTSYLPRITDLLAAKYGTHRFDVVVAGRSEALEYVLANRRTVFLGAPLVFMDISRAYLDTLGPIENATGVLLSFDIPRAIQWGLALRPGTRHVAVVTGGSEFDRQNLEIFRTILKTQVPGMDVVPLGALPLEEQLRRLSKLPERSVVLVPSYRADAQGGSLVSDQVIPSIAASANAPTIGFAANWLGSGIVGGDLLQYEVLGDRGAELTARIVNGEAASSIPLNDEPWSAPLYDWRALQRWKIDEALLPAGSTVLFRQPTLWSQYKVPVVAGISIVAVEGVLIGALLFERRRRQLAQTELVEAEQRYRTVADFAADWAYWIRPDGSFAFVSPSSLQITGYDSAEFMQRPDVIAQLLLDELPLWESRRQLAERSDRPFNFECRVRTKSGEMKWLDVVISPVAAPDGSSLGVRGSARDVTAKKRAEEELRRALEENQKLRSQLEIDNTYLREEVQRESTIDGVLGTSEVMEYVVSKIQQVAPTPSTVLLLGETGVGKTLLAQAIHNLSARRSRPLVTLNCAAIPPTLVESELFGHEKGAFTGAQVRRAGRFEIAHGGTLFLDEIGELPLDLQAKLLRVVQDGEFERVGSSASLKTDVRLIVATNHHMDADVRAGRFRQDLWYRLNIFPITVPPLRQRPEDIPLLVAHLLQKHCRKMGRPVLEVSRATIATLQAHAWPGNVRELENVIERAVILSHGKWAEISVEIPESADQMRVTPSGPSSSAGNGTRSTLDDLQREHIRTTLEELNWRVEGRGGAAEILGMNPNTLRSRMRKLGLRRPGHRPAEPLAS
jgi:formate hydrogenlyase transcriptional activator